MSTEAIETTEEVKTETTEQLPFPEELAFNAAYYKWDDSRKQSEAADYYKNNPDKVPAKKEETTAAAGSEEGGQGEGGEKPSGEEKPAETTTAATEFDFTTIDPDIKSADDVKAFKQRAIDAETKLQEMADAFDAFSRDKELLAKAKSPYKTDVIRQLNNFVDATGIEDLDVARRIIGTTPEAMAQDPLTALTVNYLLENPEFASKGFDKVYKQICKENGVDPSTPYSEMDEDVKDTLDFKAVKALKNISEKSKEFNKDSDFFASLQTETQENTKVMQERIKAWEPKKQQILNEVLKGQIGKYKNEKFGEYDLSVAVSEDQAKKILEGFIGYMGQNDPDDKSAQIVKTGMLRTLMTSENVHKMLDNVLETHDKKRVAEITAEITKKFHNGQDPVVARPAAPASGSPDFKSWYDSKNKK